MRLRLAEDAEGVQEGEDRDTGRAGRGDSGDELARLTVPRRRGRVGGRRHEGALATHGCGAARRRSSAEAVKREGAGAVARTRAMNGRLGRVALAVTAVTARRDTHRRQPVS